MNVSPSSHRESHHDNDVIVVSFIGGISGSSSCHAVLQWMCVPLEHRYHSGHYACRHSVTRSAAECNIAKLTSACYFYGSSSDTDGVELITFSSSDAIPSPSTILPCTAIAVIGQPLSLRLSSCTIRHITCKVALTVISSRQYVVATIEVPLAAAVSP